VQISTGKLSIVEVLSEAIAQSESFDAKLNAVIIRDFEVRFLPAR
jgi:hypothetical protein